MLRKVNDDILLERCQPRRSLESKEMQLLSLRDDKGELLYFIILERLMVVVGVCV